MSNRRRSLLGGTNRRLIASNVLLGPAASIYADFMRSFMENGRATL